MSISLNKVRRMSKVPGSPQSTLSRALLDCFYEQCNWTHEVWTLRRALFDGNRRKRTLDRGPHKYFLDYLQTILTAYFMLQIAKLHDPAVASGRVSLTLDYVVEYGGWDTATKAKLVRNKRTLDKLGNVIRLPRNKLIVHNDLSTVLQGEPLGAFSRGGDISYFKSLQRFMKRVYISATGSPCADFSTFTKGDARSVILALAADTAKEPRRSRVRTG